jgi:hypothetical protein
MGIESFLNIASTPPNIREEPCVPERAGQALSLFITQIGHNWVRGFHASGKGTVTVNANFCLRLMRPFGAILAAAAVAGCGGTGSGPVPTGPQADLSRSRAIWIGRNLRSYRFTLQLGCFCAPTSIQPVVIEVRNGAPTSVKTLAGDPVDPATFDRYETIEKLFTAIQNTLDARGRVVDAAYDPSLGFPASAFLDPLPMAADDELSISVTDFRPL